MTQILRRIVGGAGRSGLRSARMAAAIGLLAALSSPAPVRAQEAIAAGKPSMNYAPGWMFIPSFGFGETYDDNISLFGVNTVENANNDFIADVYPGVGLHYSGRHTTFSSGYTASLLQYRTYSALNRWDQSGSAEIEHQPTMRLKLFAHANAAAMPATDMVDLGGIPYRHVGAQTVTARGGAEYALGDRNTLTSSYQYLSVGFDRPETLIGVLRGGHVQEVVTSYRHRLSTRLALGGDYAFRRATVIGEAATFDIHTTQAVVDYALSRDWTVTAGGGAVYLQATELTAAHSGPSWVLEVARHHDNTTFRAAYLRSYIPSFGFGGTVQNQEVTASVHIPILRLQHVYTDQMVTYRDDEPLTDTVAQLPLRSLRTFSIVGWQPFAWIRIEGFYSRVQQSTLRPGGDLYRNRVGIQFVTSKPMRLQ